MSTCWEMGGDKVKIYRTTVDIHSQRGNKGRKDDVKYST